MHLTVIKLLSTYFIEEMYNTQVYDSFTGYTLTSRLACAGRRAVLRKRPEGTGMHRVLVPGVPKQG
jgi:ribosomal protein L19